jgi:hypothetical protein
MISVNVTSSDSVANAVPAKVSAARAQPKPAAPARKRSRLSAIFPATVTRDQSKDTGMALVLVLLLLFLARHNQWYVTAAVAVHLVNMTAPGLFRPAAIVWFGLSHVMGAIVSRVLLTAVFFLVVTPVAKVRQMIGADPMQLRGFKKSTQSVMQVRNHTFTAKDIEHPY